MKTLLYVLAVASTYFSLSLQGSIKLNDILNNKKTVLEEIKSLAAINPFLGVAEMLHKETTLNKDVAIKVLTSLQCAEKYNVNHNNILTIIDYSLPSNEKRLWVFDLQKKQLLYHTYVSHGINSGSRFTDNLSNKNNSKASSLGVYTTEQSYFGRDGISLRLDGLEKGFNNNANMRYIVMHGSWYTDENFIKKYGRAGRSWGCPAVPLDLASNIISTIKNKSLLVAYYPNDDWFIKSKFLHCGNFTPILQQQGSFTKPAVPPAVSEDNGRESIVFADLNKNNRFEENDPVLTMKAERYKQFFQKQAPLERMLRRQINQEEYIVLTIDELKALVNNPMASKLQPIYSASLMDKASPTDNILGELYFVVSRVNNERGYNRTSMHIQPYGEIKKIDPYNLQVVYNGKTLSLRSTNQFIRWLGL